MSIMFSVEYYLHSQHVNDSTTDILGHTTQCVVDKSRFQCVIFHSSSHAACNFAHTMAIIHVYELCKKVACVCSLGCPMSGDTFEIDRFWWDEGDSHETPILNMDCCVFNTFDIKRQICTRTSTSS